MSVVAQPSGRQHRLSDWLALHQLDAGTCRQILNAIAANAADELAQNRPAKATYPPLKLEVGWSATVAAMRDFFPEQQVLIDDTFERTEKILVDQAGKSRKAVTLDNGPAAYPTILLSYHGEPRDWLVMAHEFGHAVQIKASRGNPVPPIMRETCAFIGEAALLSHALQRDPARHGQLIEAWRRDSRRYFGVQSAALETALSMPDQPYRYAWNYPIARYFAVEIMARCPRDWMWQIFAGEISVRDALLRLGEAEGN